MTTLLLAISLSCPTTKLIGFNSGITEIDIQNFKAASKNCIIHFSDAPCLIIFEKRDVQVYWATCGKKR